MVPPKLQTLMFWSIDGVWKSMVPVARYHQKEFARRARHVKLNGHPPNMLEYFCHTFACCRWREQRYYFHPSCVPLHETIASDDPNSQRICPGCEIYICSYGSKLCSDCKAGERCCWNVGVGSYAVGCDHQPCGNCGKSPGHKQWLTGGTQFL